MKSPLANGVAVTFSVASLLARRCWQWCMYRSHLWGHTDFVRWSPLLTYPAEAGPLFTYQYEGGFDIPAALNKQTY